MNSFRDDEVVQVQGRSFPVVGARLRLAHEANQRLSIKTDLVQYELDQMAVVRATVETEKGSFTGTGVATTGRDPRLTEALLELAETRSVARALRLAGYGVETAGIEEVADGHVLGSGHENDRALRVVNGPAVSDQSSRKASSRPYITGATSAQRRALDALARKLDTDLGNVVDRVFPGVNPDELSLAQASSLIDQMKAKAGNGGNGNGARR